MKGLGTILILLQRIVQLLKYIRRLLHRKKLLSAATPSSNCCRFETTSSWCRSCRRALNTYWYISGAPQKPTWHGLLMIMEGWNKTLVRVAEMSFPAISIHLPGVFQVMGNHDACHPWILLRASWIYKPMFVDSYFINVRRRIPQFLVDEASPSDQFWEKSPYIPLNECRTWWFLVSK